MRARSEAGGLASGSPWIVGGERDRVGRGIAPGVGEDDRDRWASAPGGPAGSPPEQSAGGGERSVEVDRRPPACPPPPLKPAGLEVFARRSWGATLAVART